MRPCNPSRFIFVTTVGGKFTMAPCPSNVMMLSSDPTGKLLMNLKNARFMLVHRPLTPIVDVRSRSSTYLLDLGTMYSNLGSEASFAKD